jgi:hypothetical protein
MNDQKVPDRALGLLVPKLAFVSETPLLPTESREKFEEFSTTLGKGLNTKNIVEDLLAIDIRAIAVDEARLRRVKTNLIKMAFPDAIERLFLDLLPAAETEKAQTLARNWATDKAAKEEVKRILANFHLDEYAIEAEAIRGLAPMLAELEVMLASLQFRKIRALRTLSDCYFVFS